MRPECRGCVFWKYLGSSATTAHCCHFMVDTGMLKQVVNGVCVSRQPRGNRGTKKTVDGMLK